MKKLLVQAGNLKNKSIFSSVCKKHSNFTTSIIKKSVFSVLDSFFLNSQLCKKENFVFVDLFSGSGQMGIEALSRGFQKSVFLEISRSRFSVLKKQPALLNSNFEIYNKDAFRYYKRIRDFKDKQFIYFLDPPYTFWDYNLSKLQNLVFSLKNCSNISGIIIQCNKEIFIEDFQIRKFSKSYLLSFFRFI